MTITNEVTCRSCGDSFDCNFYAHLKHVESIDETNECCRCRNDMAHCRVCDEFYSDPDEVSFISESSDELCREHYEEIHGKPDWMEESMEEFMDSFDPDWD